jgi:hypothetical protein
VIGAAELAVLIVTSLSILILVEYVSYCPRAAEGEIEKLGFIHCAT